MATCDRDFAFLAHDLSQVLWAIQGRARALALGLPAPAAAEVSLIAEDAAMAAAMLAGRSEAAADPGAVARDAWRQTLDRARAMSLPVDGCRLHGPQAAPRVAVPEHILRRILGNLFANAVAAGGGNVTVTCAPPAPDGLLRIEVGDDGPGIEPRLRARLFAGGRSPGQSGGGGLGLPGARALARRFGGDLTLAESRAGACFALTIPVAVAWLARDDTAVDPGRSCALERDRSAGEVATGLRVLVVDDDRSIREMLESLLTTLGHRPTLVEDCEIALASNAAGRFDAAIIDLGLPGRSGMELAGRLRAQDQALATVLITGWGREENLAEAPADCVDLKGVKPLDLPQLRQLLTRAARLTAARRGAREPEA